MRRALTRTLRACGRGRQFAAFVLALTLGATATAAAAKDQRAIAQVLIGAAETSLGESRYPFRPG